MRTQPKLYFLISLLATISVSLLLNLPLGPLPALVPLFNPATGIWLHHKAEWKTQKLRGLSRPVQVAIDKSGVFHIFAQNDADLYLAQGFLVARYRLFQMDMSTRVAGGRLSELVGAGGEKFDRYFIQFGLRDYSRAALQRILADPQAQLAVRKYLEGVNQWIDQLRADTVPPEYKILGFWPEKMDESRVSNLLLLMAYNLAGRSTDLEQTRLRKKYGKERMRELFPEFFPEHLESYVVPVASPQGRDLTPSIWPDQQLHIEKLPDTYQPDSSNGSNNFAVTAGKSATGSVILANDTHLGYSLPNVWIENHLVAPGLNVYGVSFPMGPGVVLGFNEKAAWGVTNGTTDVLDWFEVEFKDAESFEYKSGEEWKTAVVQNESYIVKGQGARSVRTILTDFGYVLQRENKWGVAAKWSGEKMGNEFTGLLQLNRARNFADCVSALDSWYAPSQNWICADAKSVGLFHRGWIPVRQTGEGQFLEPARPGVWQKGIPFSELPHVIDPASGFVRSANERVVDSKYKYYMGWDYEDPARAKRISQVLETHEKISAQNLIGLQNDIFDTAAEQALPELLKHLQITDLNTTQQQAVNMLAHWNFLASNSALEPTLFKEWWWQLKKAVLKDVWVDDKRPVFLARSSLQNLLEKGEFKALVTPSFLDAWKVLAEKFGQDFKAWNYSKLNKTVFPHLAKLPGFAVSDLPTDGTALAVRANQGHHGPVYKLVVELGESPKAWTMVPGGPEGDPFSVDYGRDLKEWSKGEMKPVHYWKNWAEAVTAAAQVFELEPEEMQ